MDDWGGGEVKGEEENIELFDWEPAEVGEGWGSVEVEKWRCVEVSVLFHPIQDKIPIRLTSGTKVVMRMM